MDSYDYLMYKLSLLSGPGDMESFYHQLDWDRSQHDAEITWRDVKIKFWHNDNDRAMLPYIDQHWRNESAKNIIAMLKQLSTKRYISVDQKLMGESLLTVSHFTGLIKDTAKPTYFHNRRDLFIGNQSIPKYIQEIATGIVNSTISTLTVSDKLLWRVHQKTGRRPRQETFYRLYMLGSDEVNPYMFLADIYVPKEILV